MDRDAKRVVIWGAIAFVIVVAFAISGGTFSTSSVPDETGARLACHHSVRQQLRAPSTASFAPASDTRIARSGSEWTLTGWVDAENAFGATVRSTWRCEARWLGDGEWEARTSVTG